MGHSVYYFPIYFNRGQGNFNSHTLPKIKCASVILKKFFQKNKKKTQSVKFKIKKTFSPEELESEFQLFTYLN